MSEQEPTVTELKALLKETRRQLAEARLAPVKQEKAPETKSSGDLILAQGEEVSKSKGPFFRSDLESWEPVRQNLDTKLSKSVGEPQGAMARSSRALETEPWDRVEEPVVRQKTPAGKSWDQHGSSSDEEGEFGFRPQQKKSGRKQIASVVGIVKNLPRTLRYDGKSSWRPFKHKFVRYADACDWTEDQCLDGLCWCLTGKAADFHSILLERPGTVSYSELMRRLEYRYGEEELAETTEVRFHQAEQSSTETIEDWADRVVTLATRAFKDLPEQYLTRQAVVQFCTGLLDKEAGQNVCMLRPSTMETAMDQVRWFQHTHKAMYAKSGKRDQRRGQRDRDDDVGVWAVQESDSSDPASKRMGDLEEAMNKLQQGMIKMTSQLEQLCNNPASSSGGRKPGGACFACGKRGHFKRECPGLQGQAK